MMRRRRKTTGCPLFEDGGNSGEVPEAFEVRTVPVPAAALALVREQARIAAAICLALRHPERFPRGGGAVAPHGK